MLDKIESALPKPEQMDVVGEEFDTWRNAFRFNQGFELQSTLMPFALAHADALSPAIRERFEIASRITKDEARIGREIRAAAKERLQGLARPGTMILMPTTPTLPPERDIPDGASTVEFRAMTLGSTCLAGHAGLPQISIPAGTAAGCPVGLSFIGWEGGDEALLDLAVKLAPTDWGGPLMILATLGSDPDHRWCPRGRAQDRGDLGCRGAPAGWTKPGEKPKACPIGRSCSSASALCSWQLAASGSP